MSLELPKEYEATQLARPVADENLAAIRGYSNHSSQAQPRHVTFEASHASLEPSERSVHDHGLSLLDAPEIRTQELYQSPAQSHFSDATQLPVNDSPDPQDDPRPLNARLRAALQRSIPWPQEPQQWFLPSNELCKLIQPDTVKQYLGAENITNSETTQATVDYICGTGDNAVERQGARRLFCILLLIGKPQFIPEFYAESLFDRDLPLEREHIDQHLFRLVRKDGLQLSCFRSWDEAYLRQFDEYQWWTLAPFLTDDPEQHNSPLLKYHLDDRAILPWNHCDFLIRSPTGTSEVRKIQIHPSHHKFSSVRKCSQDTVISLMLTDAMGVAKQLICIEDSERTERVRFRSQGPEKDPTQKEKAPHAVADHLRT